MGCSERSPKSPFVSRHPMSSCSACRHLIGRWSGEGGRGAHDAVDLCELVVTEDELARGGGVVDVARTPGADDRHLNCGIRERPGHCELRDGAAELFVGEA